MQRFLVLHGLEGSGPDHWQTWITGRLRERGHSVEYPDLPEPFDPHPAAWEEALGGVLESDQTVLCHSLACLLWMRSAAKASQQLAERVLLVAPPWRDDLEPVARFLDHGADPESIGRAAEETLIVCSDDDPYCPPGALDTYATPLEIPALVIPGAGHVNTDAGYGEWPWVEAWALGDAD